MKPPIRILLVDDNPDDRALVIRELRREFPNSQIEQIIDANTFEEALRSPHFDLAITDYQLLWTNGLAVFRRLKVSWPDCPVIMFTGTGSEEIAVEAMKAGVDDYVLKSPRHFSRLPSAAKLALKVARQRLELKEAERRYSMLFDTVPIGLYRATPSGVILDANASLVEMLGYPAEDLLLNVNAADLYAQPEDFRLWHQAMERDGVVRGFETQLRCYNGSLCWVQDCAKAIRDPYTQEVFFEGSLQDISDRKKAEQEREQLISELQEALAKVKTLSGLLPVCASCKKIRDDEGYWNPMEVFIQGHSDAEFTHSFCPDCMKQLYPEVFEERVNR
jgi:PAS domain S-box-containing protein